MRKSRHLLVALFRLLWSWIRCGHDPGNWTCSAIRAKAWSPYLSFAGEKHIRSQHLPKSSVRQTCWAARCSSVGSRRTSITRRCGIWRGGVARVVRPSLYGCAQLPFVQFGYNITATSLSRTVAFFALDLNSPVDMMDMVSAPAVFFFLKIF